MRPSPPPVLTAALGAALVLGCGQDLERPGPEPVGPARFEVEIHSPERLRGLRTALTDANGLEISVSCQTCHEGRDMPMLRDPSQLTQFHVGMAFQHGASTCASCHDPERRDMLRTADGTLLPMTEAMTLCRQCHGPQARDYDRGAHGGAAGFWDLSRGPQVRNHCVDCHDPHVPMYPTFEPMPGPRDRFLGTDGDHQ